MSYDGSLWSGWEGLPREGVLQCCPAQVCLFLKRASCFVPPGDDANVSCIAELVAAAIAQQTSQTVLDARKKIWMVDSNGLVTRERGDSSTLEGYKLPFCHSGERCHHWCGTKLGVVTPIQATILLLIMLVMG